MIDNNLGEVRKFKNILVICLVFVFFVIQLTILSSCSINQLDVKKGTKGENIRDNSENENNNKNGSNNANNENELGLNKSSLVDPNGNLIKDRFKLPEGFTRIEAKSDSFAEYLRSLTLKPHGTEVKYYDGRLKSNSVYEAVIDVDVGNQDLQQCADAVMRLYAEYLFKNRRFEEISFDFANGFKASYKNWMDGRRIVVDGNRTYWVNSAEPSNKYSEFRRYLDVVFAYANTVSLAGQMRKKEVKDMSIGDVFITSRPGGLGHAVIVIDMAENKTTGRKIFMIAQSYMPAQDIHVLKNQGNISVSPWYELDFGENLKTPEWTFSKDELYSF